MITAVIPCFNAEPFLAEAIESVLAQTRPVDEVIVVDDASTDRSREVASRFPVKLLCMPVNRGHAAARNMAIAVAQGDLLAWLDADDRWEPHHTATVCGLLDRFPEAAVAYGSVRLCGARNEVWSNFPCHHRPTDVFWDCFRGTIVPAMAAVTRKAAVVEVGGFNETVRSAPDFDFWLRLARRYPFVCTQEVTATYRWHDGQISRQPLEQLRSMYASRWRFHQSVPSDQSDFRRELETRLLKLWRLNLWRAWRRGAMDEVRVLVSLASMVPGAEPLVLRWRALSLVPGAAIRGLKRTLRPFKTLLRSVRGS